jgi:RimJ/RimL family protein N-acetyltransferase
MITTDQRALDKSAVSAVLAGYRYGRFIEDSDLQPSAGRAFLTDELSRLLLQPHVKTFGAFEDGHRLVGFLVAHESAWDTDHFGVRVWIVDGCYITPSDYETEFRIADLLVGAFDRWSREARIEFVSVKAASLDLPVVNVYEKWGFRYIESWVYNRFNLDRVGAHPRTPMQLRLAGPADREFMHAYSQEAFSLQRFHADHRIPHDKADSMYRKWIDTAFDEPRQKTLVYDQDGVPAAYLIFYINDYRPQFGKQYVQWKMALLGPSVRGRGVGADFFVSLLYYHRDQGMDVVDSGLTMRNLPSLNLHNRIGFKIISTLVTFHKWLERV